LLNKIQHHLGESEDPVAICLEVKHSGYWFPDTRPFGNDKCSQLAPLSQLNLLTAISEALLCCVAGADLLLPAPSWISEIPVLRCIIKDAATRPG